MIVCRRSALFLLLLFMLFREIIFPLFSLLFASRLPYTRESASLCATKDTTCFGESCLFSRIIELHVFHFKCYPSRYQLVNKLFLPPTTDWAKIKITLTSHFEVSINLSKKLRFYRLLSSPWKFLTQLSRVDWVASNFGVSSVNRDLKNL